MYQQLQSVQNASAGLIMRTCRREHITPILTAHSLSDAGLNLSSPRLYSRHCLAWHCRICQMTASCCLTRCLKLLYPALSYSQALNKSGLDRLNSKHDVITQKMF